jgi:hypothetical protein
MNLIDTQVMPARINKSGGSRRRKRGNIVHASCSLVIVHIEGSDERVAFDKMFGTSVDGLWQINGDDLVAWQKAVMGWPIPAATVATIATEMVVE